MLLQRLCLSVALLSSFPLMAQSSSAPTASAGAESLADQWSKASAMYDRRRTIPLIHMQGARQLRSDDRDVAAVKIIDHTMTNSTATRKRRWPGASGMIQRRSHGTCSLIC
jgi:hypothetical protein